MGGSRHGVPRQMVALLVTMLLGGLWHGAGWNFIAWGGLHGVALAINHLWTKAGFSLPKIVGWFLMMMLVVAGWVLFRADSFTTAGTMLQKMFDPESGAVTLPPFNYASWEPLLATKTAAILLGGFAIALFIANQPKTSVIT